MESIWKATSRIPEFPHLERDCKTDVLIIGGGMAGVLCAYMLAQDGVDYMLIEADRICGGVTGNTTAKITAQHGLIYDKLIHEFGTEEAQMYLQANQEAVQKYREIAQNIDCDMETKSAYVYSTYRENQLEKEMEALEKIGAQADFVNKVSLPFPVAGAIRFEKQAQFHPLKFISGIAEGLNIYENTAARAFEGNTVLTDYGRITAKKIIVATHFPMLNKHGSYFIKMYQHRSYVIALEHAADVDGMYMDEQKNGLSFRNQNGLLLLGGGAHRTGKQGGNWAELSTVAKMYYPKAQEKYRWATQDCMTLDGVPYIGQYSKRTPDLYVATGFNKWGMTSSMVSAMLLRDLVQGRENAYASVFSPSRTILRPQLFSNIAAATANLLTFSTPRCPHMGCALKWNEQEHSWDCPCHGSRFTEDGTLINNPATGDLKKR